MVKLDPRPSILTQDAPSLWLSCGRQSISGATGESLNKISPFFEQCKADLAHASGDAGNGDVGILASGPMLAVKPTEVSRAANRNPGRFDESPLQPFVTALDQGAMINSAAAGMGPRNQPGIGAQFG
jgi:hypothetical protein